MQNTETKLHRYGLVMEGGAMRGLFTAGVTDVLMENRIVFDGAVGVSAGAVFGCNYKSNQPGRVLRYNLKYCKDPRFCSFRSLIKTGDMYGADFCYREIPYNLDLFDTETYRKNPMEFWAVATDVETGKPVYKKCENADVNDLEFFRASASMPLVSRIVETDGKKLLDGGISDSVPLEFFERRGFDRNIVILTQPRGYVKEKNKMLPLIKRTMRNYPNFFDTTAKRHEVYNSQTEYVFGRENEGQALVICPPEKLPVARIEHSPEKLKVAYDIGRKTAEERLPKIKEFLNID